MPAAVARKPESHSRPQAQARNFVSFGHIESEIETRLKEAQKSLGKFPPVPKAEFVSKWGPIRHPLKNKLVGGGWNGWLIIHPLKLFKILFYSPKKGRAAFKRDNKRYAAAEALRKELRTEERFKSAYQRYENRLRAAASQFRNKANNASLRPGEIGFWQNKFFEEAEEARQAFRHEIQGLITEFRKEAVKRGVVEA